MHICPQPARWLALTTLACAGLVTAAEAPHPDIRGSFRSASPAIYADISPPLRSMQIIPPADTGGFFFNGTLMADPWAMEKPRFGPQDRDQTVQPALGRGALIPAPSQNFNVGTGSANPPDPVGDVGPNHYVRMSNSQFQIFNKTGTSLFGPANINTLWAGFGGPCQTENAGDPIVLHDQIADRWLITQFSDSVGPTFFNCVALSTSADPLGTYQRYAFAAATFPDYPKYGIWPNAYLITTREIDADSIGVYALDRQQMLSGSLSPTVVSFVTVATDAVDEFVGDGLLPADLDGATLPPAGSPAYFLASMDNGGPYGAAQDALALWKLNLNFANPPASTFVMTNVIPIAPYDTIYPCNGRSCIPQPAPLGAVDILSYRQRPMHRAAYRNYGSYESIVTNQSVEAADSLAGIRWWEIQSPNSNPQLTQDATYAPGITDGVHRWMGSIAADRSGNMALGYSASSSSLFPSIRYTGRLERDPYGEMAQGEGTFIAGGGGHTAATRRWGDYTSMNVDPSDDCTFWYINEYFATSGTTWTLRAGSFKFPDCGQPNFGIVATPLRQAICAPANAVINVTGHSYNGFSAPAALAATGNPAGTSVLFAPPTIPALPGTSTLTIGNTNAAAHGDYTITVTGTGNSLQRARDVQLSVFTQTPAAPALASPADGATGVSPSPVLSWTAVAQGVDYVVEVASDPTFATIVYTSPATSQTSLQLPIALQQATVYYWRVRVANICGTSPNSPVRMFKTRLPAGQCEQNEDATTNFSDNIENGANGWTTDPAAGTTWTRSTARPSSPTMAWLATGVATASDQRLISPPIAIPAGQGGTTLRFRHDVTLEPDGATACFDGGFMEVSTNDGATWTPLPPGAVLEDPYDGPLATGQQAWCGTQAYTTASVDLSSFAGQTVRVRFRAQTDTSVGTLPHGWYVDDVQVVGCTLNADILLRNGFE